MTPTIKPLIRESARIGPTKNFILGILKINLDKKACEILLATEPSKLIPNRENVFLKNRIGFITMIDTIPPQSPR